MSGREKSRCAYALRLRTVDCGLWTVDFINR